MGNPGNVFVLQMFSKASVHEVFMHHFEKLSASGGFAVRPPSCSCHWSRFGTSVLQTPSLSTPEKILRAPVPITFNMTKVERKIFRHKTVWTSLVCSGRYVEWKWLCRVFVCDCDRGKESAAGTEKSSCWCRSDTEESQERLRIYFVG